MSESAPRPYAGLRVVELPGPVPALLGMMLAALGAEVTKLVAPDEAGRDSLYALAYHRGKRFEPVEMTSADGQRAIRALAATADVVIDAEAPGRMAALGLDHDRLSATNPGLISVSITSFGQDGPYAAFLGSDLVHLAMGGYLQMTGPADGPPLKVSAPYQTWCFGSMHGLVATLMALRQRRLTGRGTRIDQALRDTGVFMLTHTYQFWDILGINLKRQGAQRDMGGGVSRLPTVWPCKDGFLVWLFQTGHIGGPRLKLLVEWMHQHGMASEWLRSISWSDFDYLSSPPEVHEQLRTAFQSFFATKTKRELFEQALHDGLMLAPLRTIGDLLDCPQMEARGAWQPVALAAGRTARLPGLPVHLSRSPWQPLTAPPAPTTAGGPSAIAGERPDGPSAPPSASGRSAAALVSGSGVPPALPLAGLVVVDFSTTVAGPTASRHLADFGARVIKVESVVHSDTLRSATPHKDGQPGINRSGYFAAYNAGKDSLALNMQQPRSREVMRKLVERADVLIEAFVPGVMERWGLGYEQVRQWNPRIIMASHCLEGQTGPYAKHRGFGQIASAMSGWYDLTGETGGEPLGPYSAYTDFINWPFLTSAILAALEHRERTGEGQYIDHAQMEGSLHFLSVPLLDLQVSGRLLTRRGNRDDEAAPNHAYPCNGQPGEPPVPPAAELTVAQLRTPLTDRWLAITVTTDSQWQALCRVLGHPEAAADLRFATHAARKANEDELDLLLARWTWPWDAYGLMHTLQAAGVPAGVVQRAEDLLNDPQLVHRRFFTRLPHAELGEHAVLTQSFRINGLTAGPFRAAPLMGEHTFDILEHLLGMSADEIAELAAAGALE